MLSTLQQNLESVRRRMEAAATKAGRSSEEIKLVAVTKYVDIDTTSALVSAGQNVLGESRPQKLWDKSAQLADRSVEWHLIGHLQRNKINRTLPCCSLIHSIDSIRLLRAVNESSCKLQKVTNCLLEINISGESAKHGFDPTEIESVLVAATELTSVKINGLMGMASIGGDETKNRSQFARLRELRDRFSSFKSDNLELNELSMGMSGDFEAAIAEGATLVRIGSILFEGI